MQRPPLVNIFGILNIVFGVIGILGVIFSIVVFAFTDGMDDSASKIMRENEFYGVWIKWNMPLGIRTSAALIVAGVGLLKLKEWARKLSVAYAVYGIVFGIVGLVVNYVCLMRPMMTDAAQRGGAETMIVTVTTASSNLGGLFSLVYPIFLLVMMTRTEVVAAFRFNKPPPLP
jgi:hypothetical protein